MFFYIARQKYRVGRCQKNSAIVPDCTISTKNDYLIDIIQKWTAKVNIIEEYRMAGERFINIFQTVVSFSLFVD